jgi:hypothetical protein
MEPVDISRPLSLGTRLVSVAARGPANASSLWSDPPERGRRVLELGFCSAIFAWLVLDVLQKGNDLAVDFHYAFWPAARAVLEGRSPFPTVVDFYHLPFVYPAPAALLFAPFGLLPRLVADVLFTCLLAVCLVLALRLLRVADWRCYGLAFLWAPVFSALQTANLTLLLALGLALLWRLRDRTLAAGFVAAILIALKIFLWPVVLWLAVRRGWRVAAWSILVTMFVTLASWWAIGFAGFAKYPGLVRLIDRVEAPRSYSLVALGMRLGLGRGASTALALAIAGAVLAGALVLARREADGRRSFALAIAATILLSPVVWLHYFALLIVPIAILRPRFGPVWLLPLLLWPCPVMISGPTWWPLAPLLIFGSAIAVVVGRGRAVDLRSREPAPALL